MKKITLLFLFLLSLTFCSAQQVVSLVSINGQTLSEFKVATNATLQIGSSYDFVIDYSGQDLSNANNVIVKMLVGGTFADTANIASVPITTASGQVTVTLTPTAAVEPSIMQIRTSSSVNFANSGDNIFDYGWKIVAGTASVDDFGIEKELVVFPNPAKDLLNIKGNKTPSSYKIVNLLGKNVKESTFTNTIDISKLNSGLYFLIYDNKTFSKFIKQ